MSGMTIDWNALTPWSALAGGALIVLERRKAVSTATARIALCR